MRKKYLPVAAVFFFSTFMYGCVASESDTDFLYSRQREIETTLKRTQKDIDWLKSEVGNEEKVLDIKEKTFELENKLLELEQIIGRIHEQIKERFKSIESNLSMSSDSRAEDAVPEPPPPPAAAAPAEVSETPADEVSETPAEKTETKPPPAEEKPEENYSPGVKEFAEGNYELARALLRKHLADAPRSDETSDAMFLIADSYFREKLYEEAILEYQNIIETWPASPKIPLCQLNQGLALMEIGKPNEASLFFESLIEAYPKSPEAAEAKKHLKNLSMPEQ